MTKVILFDFCRVFLLPKNKNFLGPLNDLDKVMSANIDYKFSDYFSFNTELLKLIKEKRLYSKYELYMLTSGKIHSRDECKKFLNGTFREVVSTNELKMRKNKSNTYSVIAKRIGFKPVEILFIDNNRENTLAAEEAGMLTITYRNNMQLKTELEGYI